jgi:hypothetical protein
MDTTPSMAVVESKFQDERRHHLLFGCFAVDAE